MSGRGGPDWARVRAVLDEAFDRPAADRAAFLDRECAGDDTLRAEVESLLRADTAQPEAFLESSAAALAAAVIESDSTAAWIGRSVGGFRITQVLGEGGMGVVFEAEQQNPRRVVALKIVRGGQFADDALLRRFRREADALARLQHPGIAAIHEAGRTPEGEPFFVMELVRGHPLSEHLSHLPDSASRTGRDQRITLFLEIADAIAYAHQRGVIHRDLKPSNVVVEESGRVKVLDFGLARITDGDVSHASIVLDSGAIQGTLPYMSPEQAAGDPHGIDLRSDVYSLGVVLYEMLTGRLPLDVRGMALAEGLRTVMEAAPQRPAAVQAGLKGDLETVLLKALEKDPGARYASVSAFAEDLRRFREHLPVLARPPGAVDQLVKLARRHRVAAAFGSVTLLALVGGIVGTTTAMIRARAAERSAQEEAATAARVSAFLESLFLISDPGQARDGTVTLREVLDRGAAEMDTALVDEPRVRGRLLGVMGQVYRNLGLYPEARALLEQSVAVRDANPEESPRERARSHLSLAGVLRREGELAEARKHYGIALAIREEFLPPDDIELASSLLGLANCLYDLQDFATALPLSERALAIARVALPEGDPDLPAFFSGYAYTLYGLQDLERAGALFAEVVTARERALGPDHPEVGYDLRTLAVVLQETGRLEEALPVAERSVAVLGHALGPAHIGFAEALSTLGSVRLARGDPVAAEEVQRRALAIATAAVGEDHYLTGMTADLLADALGAQGRRAEALALSDQAGAALSAGLPPEHSVFAEHRAIRERILAQAR